MRGKKSIDVFYKGSCAKQFVCDFLVDERVLVELKAVRQLTSVEEAQVLNYLKATRFELGLLINFGVGSLKYKRLISTNQRNP